MSPHAHISEAMTLAWALCCNANIYYIFSKIQHFCVGRQCVSSHALFSVSISVSGIRGLLDKAYIQAGMLNNCCLLLQARKQLSWNHLSAPRLPVTRRRCTIPCASTTHAVSFFLPLVNAIIPGLASWRSPPIENAETKESAPFVWSWTRTEALQQLAYGIQQEGNTLAVAGQTTLAGCVRLGRETEKGIFRCQKWHFDKSGLSVPPGGASGSEWAQLALVHIQIIVFLGRISEMPLC